MCAFFSSKQPTGSFISPIGSMYGVYLPTFGLFFCGKCRVTIYTIHGSYGSEKSRYLMQFRYNYCLHESTESDCTIFSHTYDLTCMSAWLLGKSSQVVQSETWNMKCNKTDKGTISPSWCVSFPSLKRLCFFAIFLITGIQCFFQTSLGLLSAAQIMISKNKNSWVLALLFELFTEYHMSFFKKK